MGLHPVQAELRCRELDRDLLRNEWRFEIQSQRLAHCCGVLAPLSDDLCFAR
jgi:hypothetical protein